MNKYITTIALAILLAATTFTKAQDVVTGNALPNTPSKFNDIVEVGFTDIDYVHSITTAGLTMGFRNVFAYRPSDFVSIGAGIGLESDDNSSVSVPLSADFRYYFSPTKAASPFLNLSGGYAINFKNYQNAGLPNHLFIGANFGVNIKVTNTVSLQLALGARLNQFFTGSDYPYLTKSYLSVPFTIGLEF